MELKEIERKLKQVCDVYIEKFKINQNEDWFILKIQEELGELTSTHLKLTNRGRIGDNSNKELQNNLKDEIADVLAMTILFANYKNIDIEQALNDKWFKFL